MRAILHVAVADSFDFDKYILNSLWPVYPHHTIPTGRKIKNKALKLSKNDGNPYTIDGNLWTWVTYRGNAIRLDDSHDENGNRIIIVELNSRRAVVQSRDNAVGVLLYNLETLSSVKRTKWAVKHFESTIELPWYYIQNTSSVRNDIKPTDDGNPYKNVILNYVIERKIYEAYKKTNSVTSEMIESMLIDDYGELRVEMSKQHINNTLIYMKACALFKQNNFDGMEPNDIFVFYGTYFNKTELKYLGKVIRGFIAEIKGAK